MSTTVLRVIYLSLTVSVKLPEIPSEKVCFFLRFNLAAARNILIFYWHLCLVEYFTCNGTLFMECFTDRLGVFSF